MGNGKIYNRHELKILYVRFLLEKTNPNSEFDILFFLKVKAVSQIYSKLHIYLLLGKFYCCALWNQIGGVGGFRCWQIEVLLFIFIRSNFLWTYIFTSKEYRDAKMQAEKGKKWFTKTLSTFVGLQKWNYVYFVALPNLENRNVLKRTDIIKEEEEILVNLKEFLLSSSPYSNLSERNYKRRNEWLGHEMVDWQNGPERASLTCFWSGENIKMYNKIDWIIQIFRWFIWKSALNFGWLLLCHHA